MQHAHERSDFQATYRNSFRVQKFEFQSHRRQGAQPSGQRKACGGSCLKCPAQTVVWACGRSEAWVNDACRWSVDQRWNSGSASMIRVNISPVRRPPPLPAANQQQSVGGSAVGNIFLFPEYHSWRLGWREGEPVSRSYDTIVVAAEERGEKRGGGRGKSG